MKRIVIIAIAAVILLFILQNSEVVRVNFLFWNVQFPRAVVLGITFVLGIVFGMLASIPKKRQEPE